MTSSPADSSTECDIRTQPRLICILCGAKGEPLYSRQKDHLFGARGEWSSLRCANPCCGLIWLHPMPIPDDLGKAYTNYYTHASQRAPFKASFLRRLRKAADENYLNLRFGYSHLIRRPLFARVGVLLYFFLPMRRRNLEVGLRYLRCTPGGKVLDVGCGSGDWLLEMRQRGWEVYGLDFDPRAVETAREAGLPVQSGPVESQSYPADFFDAVTLNHVIEHVPDPQKTLQECLRILKPGGSLVVITPNAESFGHRFFKRYWRGLEPPRHLHVFSFRSLKRAFLLATVGEAILQPEVVKSVIYESILLRWEKGRGRQDRSRAFIARIFAFLFNWFEQRLLWYRPSIADCVTMVAVKACRAV